MDTKATIIVLNGAGSSGKSSIARALQTITAKPCLHVAMDTFLEMLPEVLQDHPDTFDFLEIVEDGAPSVQIAIGPVGERLLRGMRAAIAALANEGNNLVVDDVMLDGEASEYRRLLRSHDLHFVGVHAPLEILEVRERERGDRMIGLARWQFERVHRNVEYDLVVDTGLADPASCAEQIRTRFHL